MAQDYYKILGVDKKATQDEIKAQYRKLVKMYHPDLHPNDPAAAAKFKEINEANEILSDPQKRAKYDYELENPYASSGGFEGFSHGASGGFSDIFDFFNGFGGFGSASSAQSPQSKGEDITVAIDLSFLDAAKGCTKEIRYSRREPCADCHGTGAKNGTEFKTCDKCHGTGQVQTTMGSGFFRTVSVRTCPDCGGSGKKITVKCDKCMGRGYNKTNTTISVNVPAGADNNSYIRKIGMGNASTSGGAAGDLFIQFRVREHKILQRRNFDILVNVPVSYKTAVLGGKIQVPGIDETYSYDLPEGTPSGKSFTLRGKGIKSRMGVGNLIFTVFIDVPTKLNRSQREKLVGFESEMEVKQSAAMQQFRTDLKSLYGVDPYSDK